VFEVDLSKVTPSEAGLGGGSSNAATVMFAANELLGYPATLKQLSEWCGEIGSDTSFFFSSGTAYCTGRGEILESIDALPILPDTLYIFKPPQGMATPSVFQKLDVAKVDSRDPRDILATFTRPSLPATGPYFVNDLEAPAFCCDPSLEKLKHRLSVSFRNVMMSGSGSSMFGLGFDDAEINQEWQDKLMQEWPGIKIFKCSPCRREAEEWFKLPSVSHRVISQRP